MSAASDIAYLSPTIWRKRSIISGESGGAEAEGWTIFMVVSCFYLLFYRLAPDCGTAQPVVDSFAKLVMRHRHHRDGACARGIERAKIAEKMGGGFCKIASRRQIHHCGRRVHSGYRTGPERQQRLAGLNAGGIEPDRCPRGRMRCPH